MPCAHGKLNVKHHRTTPKPEIRVLQQRKTKLRWPKFYSAPKRTQAAQQMKQQCEYTEVYVRVCTSEADFHKPGIYGRVRVWANEWDLFHCSTRSRGSRGRRAAVDTIRGVSLVVGFRFFFRYFERTRPTQVRGNFASGISTSNEARPKERSDRGRRFY